MKTNRRILCFILLSVAFASTPIHIYASGMDDWAIWLESQSQTIDVIEQEANAESGSSGEIVIASGKSETVGFPDNETMRIID